MNVVREIQRINEQELKLGVSGKGSWHHKYRDSAWVYVGGLPFELTEGDVICVMSQWGEVEDFNMPREEKTGKSRGWAWVKYEDQRSTVLAVDNFNGTKLLGRTLRVDHCEKYKLPKEVLEKEEQDEALAKYGPGDGGEGAQASKYAPGHAYVGKEHASEFKLSQGVDVFAPAKPARPLDDDKDDDDDDDEQEEEEIGDAVADGGKAAKKARKAAKKAAKKEKKAVKKAHKKDKKRRRNDSSDDDDDGSAPKAGFVSEGLGGAPLADPEPPRLPPSAIGDGVVVDADWRGRLAPGGVARGRGSAPRGRGPPRGRGEGPRSEMSGFGGMARRR